MNRKVLESEAKAHNRHLKQEQIDKMTDKQLLAYRNNHFGKQERL